MNKSFSSSRATIALATLAPAAASQGQSGQKRPEDLIAGLRNEATSASACENAPDYGPAAIRPLALAMTDPDFELARRCKRALAKIVHRAGRPGAEAAAADVESQLIAVLSKTETLPVQVRRDLLWLLSEIGSARVVPPIAEFLANKDLREDARCVLIRIPSGEAVTALQHALTGAPEEFKPALADALRARGERIGAFPSKKLMPTAKTSVTPLPQKK